MMRVAFVATLPRFWTGSWSGEFSALVETVIAFNLVSGDLKPGESFSVVFSFDHMAS